MAVVYWIIAAVIGIIGLIYIILGFRKEENKKIIGGIFTLSAFVFSAIFHAPFINFIDTEDTSRHIGSIPVYSKFPAIPDFGAVTGFRLNVGISAGYTVLNEHIEYIFRYNIGSGIDYAINEYIKALDELGFEHFDSQIFEGAQILFYRNAENNHVVMVSYINEYALEIGVIRE